MDKKTYKRTWHSRVSELLRDNLNWREAEENAKNGEIAGKLITLHGKAEEKELCM